MISNESVQFFVRLVDEKHSDLATSTNTLLRELAGEDPNSKIAAAEAVLSKAKDLCAILARNDIPDWLNNTISYTTNFSKGQWSSKDFLPHFVETKLALNTHRWQFDKDAVAAFDFDSIFEHYKKESRLPELFDEIIRLLEEIQASGQVDSVSILDALGKVIATIKKCKNGSYFSLNSAWGFLLSFLNNYMWGELSKLPVLGTALEALGKTIEEADEEMFKLHKQVQDEMVRTVSEEVKVLSDKSPFPFVTYNRTGYLIPDQNNRQLPDETA